MKRRLMFTLAIALILIATLSLPAVALTEQDVDATVTVGEVISITLSGTISFGNVVTLPVTDQGATGQVDGSPAITVEVGSETNVNVDIGIKGALKSGSLALEYWKYSTTFAAVTKTSIPEDYGTAVYPDVAVGSYPFYHWITVPTGTTSGTHTITVSYKATKHT